MTTGSLSEIPNQIEQSLRQELAAVHVQIEDMTAQHAHHAGARESGGGHYIVTVVSPQFEGLTLVKRHRLVYAAVASLRSSIHALGITAHTPTEWDALRS